MEKNYTVEPVTAEDVDAVFDNPWTITQQDMEAFSFDEMSRETRREVIVGTYAKDYGLAIKDENGKVIAITGACKEYDLPKTWWTWFFATPDFVPHARNVTDIVNTILTSCAEKEGALEVRAYSPANTREAIVWFKRLGFHKGAEVVINGKDDVKLNIFKRSFK